MKLIYFDVRGRAEPIRILLAAAGVKYEDKRVSYAEWAKLKEKTPWSQLPILQKDDGSTLTQHVGICRYIAREHNLAGSNNWEAAKCDEYVDAFVDIALEWVNFAWDEKDPIKKEEKKRKFVNTTSHSFFEKLNKFLMKNGSGYLVGKGLTWADVYIAAWIEDMEITSDPNLIKPFPAVVKLRELVYSTPRIKEWIQNRPPEDLLAVIAASP